MNKEKIVKVSGCTLKYYLDVKKISIMELSNITGISPKNLSRYVNLELLPKIDVALTIARALNMNIDQIWKF